MGHSSNAYQCQLPQIKNHGLPQVRSNSPLSSPFLAWMKTGHYARKSWSTTANSLHAHPRPKLLRPSDRGKDQTYYLSSISEEGLSRALFPIGHPQKSEVRELAKKHQLHNAERPDSVGICFVGEKARFSNFLCMCYATLWWYVG